MPLLNKSLVRLPGGATLFGELDVPVRFSRPNARRASSSVGLAVVVGVGF